MARLPDIPIDSWVADQQDLLEKKIGGLFPALEFKTAAMDLDGEIPYDYPYLGGQDTYEEDLRRARELELRQQQADAEERARQDEMLRQQMEQQAEQARQDALRQQTYQQARSLGIPTPDEALGLFQSAVGSRPGVGNPDTGTGAFDPAVQPYSDPDQGPREQTPDEKARYDFSGVRSADDFASYANGLNESLFGPEQPAAPAEPAMPDWRMQTERQWSDPRTPQERMADTAKPIVDGLKPILDTAGRIIAYYQGDAEPYGRVESQPGEPDYVRPRGWEELTSAERRRKGDADQGWEDSSGVLGTAKAGIDWVQSRTDPLVARTDVFTVPGLARQGIVYTDFTPEEVKRYEELAWAEERQRNPRIRQPMSPEEREEFGAFKRRLDERYEQIKAEPDIVTRYMNAAPGQALYQMYMGAVSGPALGGAAKSLAGGAARAMGATRNLSQGIGYAADFATQGALDPTNVPVQGAIDAAIQGVGSGVRALRSEPVRRVLGAADRALGGAYDELRGANIGRVTDDLQPIVEPEHRRWLVPEVRLPAPGTQERDLLETAVRSAGGTVSDDDGVRFGVTRGFQEGVTNVRTFRGGVFVEPIKAGEQSTYAAEGVKDSYVGGNQALPRTETTYRQPMLVQGGDVSGEWRQVVVDRLGIEAEPTDRLVELVGRAREEAIRRARRLPAHEREGAIAEIENQAALLTRSGRLSGEDLYDAFIAVGSTFRRNPELYEEVLRSFGGDPTEVRTMLSLPHQRGVEPMVLVENVIGTQARRRGYDGIMVYDFDRTVPGGPARVGEILDLHLSHAPTPPTKNPNWAQLETDLQRARVNLRRAETAFQREYGRVPDDEDFSGFNPDFEPDGGEMMRRVDPVGVRWFEAQSRFDALDQRARITHNDEKYVPGERPGYQVFPDVEARAAERSGYEAFPELGTRVPERVETPSMQGASEAGGTRAVDLARRSLQARGTLGSAAGGVTGFAADDPDGETTMGDRFRNAAILAGVGGVGAQRGTMEAARLVDSLIRRGHLTADVLSGHPETADRIRALFALAAKNLPDDAEVAIPNMASVLAKMEPEVRQQVASLIDGVKSAGEVRRILAEQIEPSRLGEEARTLVIDLMAGTGRRRARNAESAADRRSMDLGTERALREFAGRPPEPLGEGGAPRTLDTPYGTAVESRSDSVLSFVGRVADELGIPRPHVFTLQNDEPMAFATQAGDEPSILLSSGLTRLDLTADEMRALIAHELAHTTERSFGQELLGRAAEAAGRAVGAVAEVGNRLFRDAPFPENVGPENVGPEELAGAVRQTFAGREITIPTAGVWNARLTNVPVIPEGLWAGHQREIERAFNEAMRHLANAQNPNLAPGSKRQEKYLAMAEEAWKKYEQVFRKTTGTNPFVSSPRGRQVGSRAKARVVEPPAAPRPRADELPGDRPGAGPEVARTGEDAPVGEVRPAAEETVDDLTFEPEPLPDALDPKAIIPHEDAAKFVRQITDATVMNPTLQARIQKTATTMLTQPKIRARHLQQLAEAVGREQGVARGMTKEEAGAAWADEFFRKNGWLAPKKDAPAGTAAGVEDAGQAAGVGNAAARNRAAAPEASDAGVGPSEEELARIEESLPDLMRAGDDVPDEFPISRLEEWEMRGARRIDPNRRPAIADTDPRYQAKERPVATTKPIDPGFFERIYRALAPKITDHVAVLRMYQDDIAREYLKQTGRRLPAEMLAAELKRLDPNRQAEMDADAYLKPALRAFRRLGFSDADINTYLSYKQDIDIAAATNNPDRKFPDGATLADAQKFVAEFEAQQSRTMTADEQKVFDDALAMTWALGDRILQLKRDAGLITPKAYLDLRSKFPHYMPTRVMDYLDDNDLVGVGQSMSVSGSTVKKLTDDGTERTAVDALPALYGALYQAHAAANKNRVFNAFVDLWDTAKNLPTTQALPARGAKVAESERRSGEFGSLIMEWNQDKSPPNEFVTVQGFVNGVKKKYAVHKSLGDITKYEAPVIIPILSGLGAAFRAGATARNPVFLASNAMLDFSGYLVRETARAGGPQHLIDVTKTYMEVLGEFLLHPRNWGDIARHEYRGDMERFLAEGGGSAGAFSGSPFRPDAEWKITDRIDLGPLMEKLGIEQRSDLEKGIDRLGRDFWRDSAGERARMVLWDGLTLKPVEAIGERIELIPRIAALRLAEKRGASTVEAINAGRTTTIDFNKGGSWARTINQLVPFFNVGIQATADVQRAFAENPKAFAASVATAVVAPMVIAEAWNQADKQRAEDYRDVPDYVKDQGLVVMLPREYFPPARDKQGNERPQFFHFRYRQFAPIAMLTREVLQRAYYERDLPDEERRSAFDLVTSGLSQMSPVPTSDSADFAATFMPVGLGTMLQASPRVDRDFFRGRRIRSTYADERASPLSKGVSDLTGIRPSVVEFASRDLGTGYAGLLHGASEMAFGSREATSAAPSDTPQDTPVVGGFYGKLVKNSIGGNADRARESVLTPSAEKILRDAKVDWRPSPSNPEIANFPLTRKEYGEYQKVMNRATDQAIQEMARDAGWQKMSKADKEDILQKIVNRFRDNARREFFGTLPSKDLDRRLEAEIQKGRIPARSR